MNADDLSKALHKSVNEVLRPEINLMDDHAEAPGYILFASWNPGEPPTGKYYAYLKYLPHAEAQIPFIFGFELTDQMDTEAVKLAVMEAQDKFSYEIRKMEAMARAEKFNIQGMDRDPVLWKGASLTHYGKNPFNEDIYRVIWAPTRLYLVGGRWTDRVEGRITRTIDEYRWIQKYGDEEQGWILEKHLSAQEYAGSKLAWELQMTDEVTGLLELGPYPTRGEYESCWTFPKYPTAAQVEEKIQMLIYGKQKFSLADIRNAHKMALEGRQSDRDKVLGDMVHDAMPAFPMRGLSGSPYRSAEDNFKLSTKDLVGMPDQAGEFKQISGNDPLNRSKVN